MRLNDPPREQNKFKKRYRTPSHTTTTDCKKQMAVVSIEKRTHCDSAISPESEATDLHMESGEGNASLPLPTGGGRDERRS